MSESVFRLMWKDESRKNWTSYPTGCGGTLSDIQLALGLGQRIADALEQIERHLRPPPKPRKPKKVKKSG